MCVCTAKWKMFERKCPFHELKGEWDIRSADKLVVCLGDFHGHMGRHIDGFDEVH